jgi:hypothetical protein
MSGVAGTRAIESPKAAVYTVFPFERTCTMAAFRWFAAIELRTIRWIVPAEMAPEAAAGVNPALSETIKAVNAAMQRTKRHVELCMSVFLVAPFGSRAMHACAEKGDGEGARMRA